MHTATKHGLGPEGASQRVNKSGREKWVCQRQEQRENKRWWKCGKRWMLTWRHGENKWRRRKNKGEEEKVEGKRLRYHTSQPPTTDETDTLLRGTHESNTLDEPQLNSHSKPTALVSAKAEQQWGFVYYSPTWATASINHEQSAKRRSDLSVWSEFIQPIISSARMLSFAGLFCIHICYSHL